MSELCELVGRISDHALDRYRERIYAQVSKQDIALCLMAAKPKHMKKLTKEGKRTDYIPTGCAIFVCSYGRVVTSLAR